MTDLETRVAELEKQVGPKRTPPRPMPPQPSLQLCNQRNNEVMAEIKAEKRAAESVAVQAIKSAFKTAPGKTDRRVQKPASPIAAEALAQATKASKS